MWLRKLNKKNLLDSPYFHKFAKCLRTWLDDVPVDHFPDRWFENFVVKQPKVDESN